MTPYYLHNFFKPCFYTKLSITASHLQMGLVFGSETKTNLSWDHNEVVAQLPLTALTSDPRYHEFHCICTHVPHGNLISYVITYVRVCNEGCKIVCIF